MAVTEQDIRALTPHHRIVWHNPPGEPVEMGLYVNEGGFLCTDVGQIVRYKDNVAAASARYRIVRIIPPAFVPRLGMVIGRPDHAGRRLVRVDDNDWLGHAPEISAAAHWFTEYDARELVEEHGWEVVDDLSAPGEVTDAEVKAAAQALMEHPGARQNAWHTVARASLEAAREARNG